MPLWMRTTNFATGKLDIVKECNAPRKNLSQKLTDEQYTLGRCNTLRFADYKTKHNIFRTRRKQTRRKHKNKQLISTKNGANGANHKQTQRNGLAKRKTTQN